MIKARVLSFMLTVALVFAMVPGAVTLTEETADAATAYSYTLSRPAVKIKGETRHVPTMKIKALGLIGTCCQGGCTSKAGKATVTKISNTSLTAKIMYYYGYQKGYLGKKNLNGFKLMRALSYSRGNDHVVPLSISEVKKFINDIPSNVTVPNRFECYVCNPTNGSQDFAAYKIGSPVKVSLRKTSTDKAPLAAGSGYNFQGIEYTVFNSSGKVAGKLTCNAKGVTNTLTLDTGSYTVKETKTNKWYKKNTQVYTKTLTAGQSWTISAKDAPETGRIHIKKEIKGESSGSLAFDFILTNTKIPSITYKVRTDGKTGEANIDVVEGEYRCEELLPDDTDLIDATGSQVVTVRTGETVTLERVNKKPVSGFLRISKTTTDGGSLEGFRFKVRGVLYNQGSISEEDILRAADPVVSEYDHDKFELGKWNVNEDDVKSLNAAAKDRKTGKKTIRITNKLEYKNQEDIEQGDTENEQETESEETADESADSEKQSLEESETADKVESDIEIAIEVTVNLKDVEFIYDSVTPEASGYESDIDKQIKGKSNQTDVKEGYSIEYNEFNWHGAATVYQEIKNGALTGKTETILATDKKGQTPELQEGITSGKFTVSEEMTDSQDARYRKPDDQTMEITKDKTLPIFSFHFENKDKSTPITLRKTSEDGIVSGITFRIEGSNVLGEKIDVEAVTDEEGIIDLGKLYAGEYVISETDFDSEIYSNNEKLDGYDVPAKRIVVTGEENEGIVVDFHNTPLKELYLTKVDSESKEFLNNGVFALFESGKQIALFRLVLSKDGNAAIEMIESDPEIGLQIDNVSPDEVREDNADVDNPAGNQDSPSADDVGGYDGQDDENITVIESDNSVMEEDDVDEGEDAISEQIDYNFAVIRGLTEGKEYRISEITAPEGYAASIDHTFVFEGGQKLVLENTAPTIKTKAMDMNTGIHMSNAAGMTTIIDTVAYENLGPGHTYLLSGVLVSKPDGKEDGNASDSADTVEILCDASGQEITTQKEFIPVSDTGEVTMEFTFDASLLDGKQAVVYEELVDPALSDVDGILTVVASHADPDDEGQSIYFPEIETKAAADDTDMQITEADEQIMITDRVSYSNIIAGKEYEIIGTLMDKKTGKPVISNGQKVTASQRFIAGEEANTAENDLQLISGETLLQFVFNGSSYAGRSLVVFERLYTEGKLVGEHTDINDKEQTVELPTIATIASTNGRNRITDVVHYSGLIPNAEYVMKGVLMDKATGKELVIDNGQTKAQTEFIPVSAEGEITVDFNIDSKEMTGKTAVVFETCSIKNPESGSETEVIRHNDINNKAQTVTFKAPQTGQNRSLPLIILLNLLFVAALIAGTGKLRAYNKN